MAPRPVRERSPTKKRRVSKDEIQAFIYEETVNERGFWQLYFPTTQFACGACFCVTPDPKQHFSKPASACGIFIAIKHLIHCYKVNSNENELPDEAVVSAMINDEDCELGHMDLLAQPKSWDPTTNFSSETTNEHTVRPSIANTTFKAMYNAYLENKPEMKNKVGPIHSPSVEDSFSTGQFIKKQNAAWEAAINAEIEKRIQEGKLKRVDTPEVEDH